MKLIIYVNSNSMDLIQKFQFKFRQMFHKTIAIPDITTKRKIIDEFRLKYNCSVFVETGTFLGTTVEYFKDKFQFLHSIELSNDLAERAKNRFLNQSNISIKQGDSGEVLHQILNTIDTNVLFWLDGHYSSEFFVGDEFFKTAKGDKNTPVVRELELILQSGLDFVILIDDARLFDGTNDYPTIREVKEMVKRSNLQYEVCVSNDIIQIYPATK
jgi:hypothetical protein